jgi:hypothetical protein
LTLSVAVLACQPVFDIEPAIARTPDRNARHYAVGSGRHEPVVFLHFEDEHAYGLRADQAAQLREALLEEAEAMSNVRYPVRQ